MVHHRTNAPIKPTPLVGPWKCNVCNAKFTDIKAHVQHMRSHHALQFPFSCQLCLFRFKDNAQLANHVCLANNKSRVCNNSNINIQSNSNNCVIREENQKTKKKPEKTFSTDIISQNNNYIANKSAGSSSELSQTPHDDELDEEDIFEAAQDPLHQRARASSTETNNRSGLALSDFFVTDPWQACSAIISTGATEMVVDDNLSNDPEAENACWDDLAPRLIPQISPSTDDFINELIQPLPPPPLRKKPKRERQTSLHRKEGQQIVRRTSESKSSPRKLMPLSSNIPFESRASLPRETIRNTPSHTVVAPTASNAHTSFNAPMDLTDIEGDSEECRGVQTATQFGLEPAQPNEIMSAYSASIFNPVSPLPPSFPFTNYECTKCKETFHGYNSWAEHLIGKHISSDPSNPFVSLTRLEIAKRRRRHSRVNKNKSESCPKTAKSPSHDQSSSSEQRHGNLKFTLCRSAGKYVLKKPSTDEDGTAGDSRTSNPPSRRGSWLSTGTAEDETMGTSSSEPGSNSVLADTNRTTHGRLVNPPQSGSSSETGSASKVNTDASSEPFKSNFMQVAQSALKIIRQQREKDEAIFAGNSIWKNAVETPARNGNNQGMGASEHGENSMTFSSVPEEPPSDTVMDKEQPGTESNAGVTNSGKGRESQSGGNNAAAKNNEGESQPNRANTTVIRIGASQTSPRNEAVGSLISGQTADLNGEGSKSSSNLKNMTKEKDNDNDSAKGAALEDTEKEKETEKSPESVEQAESTPEMTPSIADEPNDPDDDNALVIDTGPEEPNYANGEAENAADKTTENDEAENGESSRRASSEAEGQRDRTPPRTDDGEGGNNSGSEGNEDFRCRVCQKMFSSDEEVKDHFSAEHIRIGDSILEPESPYPPSHINVPGNSSIFEDEVEEPEPFPVETELIEFPGQTLSSLLRRDSHDERNETERPAPPPVPIHSQPHMSHMSSGMPLNYRASLRQPFPQVRAPLPPQEAIDRRNYRYSMNPLVQPQHEVRMAGPASQVGGLTMANRPPGYPTALHQALIRQQGMGPPQLRPINHSVQMRGGQQIIPNRPPLTRVPPATQLAHTQAQAQVAARNPQSILRPISTQGRLSLEMEIGNLEVRIGEAEREIQRLRELCSRQTDYFKQQEILHMKNEVINAHGILTKQLAVHRKELLTRQEQQVLQLNQQHQLNLQNIHQQQLRQHQLQQSRSNSAPDREVSLAGLVNAGGTKRPSAVIMEPSSSGHPSKLPRMEPANSLPEAVRIHENQARMSNGNIIRQAPPIGFSSTSPGISHGAVVEPGAHSGGSNGSRHSSGSTSPAIPSPVAQRLAHSGITLTPASPTHLAPLTPPVNPNLSPVSDSSASPRGSPRMNVGHMVHNVMNTCLPSLSPGGSAAPPNNNFIAPRAPVSLRAGIDDHGKESVVTISHVERPDRPPTIDLTDDDILLHNAHMRATGRGLVTREQIQLHEASLQQRRGLSGIPGTSSFSIRPVITPQPPAAHHQLRAFSCSICSATFPTADAVNEHSIQVHRQAAVPPQSFRPPQPGTVLRRVSPGAMPQLRPNIAPHSGPPGPPPPRQPMQIRDRAPNPASLPRQQQQSQPAAPYLSAEQSKNLIIPLIHMDRLDSAKIKALNEIGVSSFIPLEGVTRLGIPVLRLRPEVQLGHFPHDTAVEIGVACQLLASTEASRPVQTQRTPPSNIPAPAHVAPPQAHPHPPSVISPPMGAICTDRSCPDRRPSPSTVIHHHHMTHAGNQISIRPVNPISHHPNQYQHPQQQPGSSHDSFLGGSNPGQPQFGGRRN